MATDEWFTDEISIEDEFDVIEYDLIATPNDFNVLTIFSFIESGAVKIPGFQRNYVWDIRRASKLIESLVLGLPVPQIFLYEEGRNQFLVIDGQQRLMSIYFFKKQRFPRKEKRAEIRRVYAAEAGIPDQILFDDTYFQPFKLALPERVPDRRNRLAGLNYGTLGNDQRQFDLRPVRNVVVKQAAPAGDDSSVFEIFNRLNTGGINLRPQEIRGSLYHSGFYDTLNHLNLEEPWRALLQLPDPDLHMKDVEVLLRGFAMLTLGHEYKPSMTRFLNRFSKSSKRNSPEQNDYLAALFRSFVKACESCPKDIFVSPRTKRFSIALYEAVFTAVCSTPFKKKTLVERSLDPTAIRKLDSDKAFIEASEKASADTTNLELRLRRAKELLGT